MQTTDDIRTAIESSRKHSRIESIDWTGTEQSLHESIAAAWIAGETDSATEEGGVLDIWGWTDKTPEGEQDWRLRVTIR